MILNPGIFPSVELNQVDAFQAQILETGVYVLLNVIGREAVIESEFAAAGPLEIFGRNFGGHIDFSVGIISHQRSQQFFAVAAAVRPGGVKKVAPQVQGLLERVP